MPTRPITGPLTRSPSGGVTGVGGGVYFDSPTVVFLGDSITEQNGGIPANEVWMHFGFFRHGVAYSGSEVTTVNAGVGGQTSAQMLARLTADVLALAPRYCHLLCGTNDVAQSVPTATTVANMASMVSQMRAAGISVAVGTIPPRSSYTGSMKADTEALNSAIRAMEGVTVIDYYQTLNDGFGVAISGTLSDGIHPGRNGASRMGVACSAWLSTLPTRQYPLFTTAGATSTQLLAYNRFQAGAAGAVPTGWQSIVSGSPVYGREARADGVGGDWFTVQNDAGESATLTSNVTIGGGLSVGDTIRAEVEVDLSPLASPPANTSGFGLYVQFYNGSTFFASADTMRFDTSQGNDHDVSRRGVLRTRDIVIPATTTIVQIVIQCRGGGTFKLDRAAIRKITP